MTWTNEPEVEGDEGREIVSNGALVATVYNPTDADLIAAAPDLLAALEDMLADAELLNEPYRNEALCERTRAAISKAKGN